MIVLAVANICAHAVIENQSSLSLTVACFSPIDSSLVFVLIITIIINAQCSQAETNLKLGLSI